MALLDHAGDNCLGHDEGSVQIHINYLAELSSRHIAHGDSLDDSRIVYQDINHAHFLLDLGYQLIYRVLIGNIAHIAERVDAFLLVSGKALVYQFLLDIIKYNGCARAGHSLCDGKADAVGSAGNQGNLALQ